MAILYLCLLCPSTMRRYAYCFIIIKQNWDNFKLFISKIHQSQHLRTRRDRIIIKERQNQLTVDHLKWLVYCSDKNWQGTRDSNPNRRFWRAECCHYTSPLYGGRNKIRTCGGVTLAAFPRRCFKPLSHSSINKLGWKSGLEPPVFGVTIRRFNQLSYFHHRCILREQHKFIANLCCRALYFRRPAILGLLNGLTACVLLCRQADALVRELGLEPRLSCL